MSKVSENFRLCLSLTELLSEEIFRFLFFNFIEEHTSSETITNLIEPDTERCNECLIEVMFSFENYIETKAVHAKNEHWKYLIYYYKLHSLFKLHVQSMNASDSIGIEIVEHSFCGMFGLMNKHKYVEIILSEMEKKFHEYSYGQLQEIRMNSSCRCEKDDNRLE